MTNPFSLEGKTILVTGASSGIGRGIAIGCSQMGARLLLNGRDTGRLNETLTMLEGKGHEIIAADLSIQSELDRLVETLPYLDGCVLCAGIPQVKPVKRINRRDLEDIFNVNTFAPILLTNMLLKSKKLSRGSSVVFIESISGVFVGTKGDVSYNASKAAVNGYVKGAGLELASQGIRVNAINPGLIPTNILNVSDAMLSEGHHEEIALERYPLKHLGTPSDIANGAIYLLSDASSWVTGINLVIDGGYLLN